MLPKTPSKAQAKLDGCAPELRGGPMSPHSFFFSNLKIVKQFKLKTKNAY